MRSEARTVWRLTPCCGHDRLPGVLVHIENPLRILMAITGRQRGFEHPYTVQFITHEVRICMVPGKQVLVLHRVGHQHVVVIRDIQFLSADKVPSIWFARPVEQTIVVNRAEASWTDRLTETICGHLSHAARPRVVTPCTPSIRTFLIP